MDFISRTLIESDASRVMSTRDALVDAAVAESTPRSPLYKSFVNSPFWSPSSLRIESLSCCIEWFKLHINLRLVCSYLIEMDGLYGEKTHLIVGSGKHLVVVLISRLFLIQLHLCNERKLWKLKRCEIDIDFIYLGCTVEFMNQT